MLILQKSKVSWSCITLTICFKPVKGHPTNSTAVSVKGEIQRSKQTGWLFVWKDNERKWPSGPLLSPFALCEPQRKQESRSSFSFSHIRRGFRESHWNSASFSPFTVTVSLTWYFSPLATSTCISVALWDLVGTVLNCLAMTDLVINRPRGKIHFAGFFAHLHVFIVLRSTGEALHVIH